ncbi:hypothetical protein D4R75_08815 [bacterium]|nr:MAG: hypothetical protein D4R75_08815 [bacterium]
MNCSSCRTPLGVLIIID